MEPANHTICGPASFELTVELTVAQIMNSLLPNSDLKKVGKTTRPFSYDLKQFPYYYTMEVTTLTIIQWK